MKSLFDYNTQADLSLYGGQSATGAVGLPVPGQLPGTFAPNASRQTAQAMAQSAEQDTAKLLAEYLAAQQQPSQAAPLVGYNPQTNQVFSQGKTFQLDLNEGRQAAAAGLLDVHNAQLPAGFHQVYGQSIKDKLLKDYENQGMIDALQRRAGGFAAGVGSTMRDLGIPGGQAIEDYGAGVVARNPGQIHTGQDILDKPLTTASEAIGEAGFDLGKSLALGGVGARVGGALGAAFGPAGIATGAVIGAGAAMFLPTLFETYGSVRRTQREQGIDDKGRALVAGAGSALMETALGPEAAVAKLAGNAAGKLTLSATKKAIEAGGVRYVAKQAGLGALTEGPLTEVPQSAIERWGGYQALTGQDALNEYLIGGVKGAIGGGGMTTVTGTMEYRQVVNFANNFVHDQKLASDLNTPANERIAAIKRVEDVLRGSSDDPQFDQQLQEFRKKLNSLEQQMASAATAEALKNGTPVDLLNDRPVGMTGDLFNVAGGIQGTELTTPNVVDARFPPTAAPTPAIPGLPQLPTAPQQTELFDTQGQPTYNAEQDFGVSPYEFRQTFQGPPVDPLTQAAALAEPLRGLSPITQQQEFARPVTGELTPMQQAALQTPEGRQPGARTPLLRGLVDLPSLDLDAPVTGTLNPLITPAPATQPSSPAQGTLPAGTPAGVSTTKTTANERQTLQKLIDATDLGAEVEGPPGMPVGGRPTLTPTELAQTRDALLNSTGTVEGIRPRAQRLADAARALARAYYKYLNAGGNALRDYVAPKKTMPPEVQAGEPARLGTKRAERTQALLEEVRKAMFDLREAAENNAKNVEVVVRLVKDMAQGRIAADLVNSNLAEDYGLEVNEDGNTEAMGKLDTMLSQVWTAAKHGMFLDKTADKRYVRQQSIRTSAEVAEVGGRNPLEVAAEGFAIHGKGDVETGLLGVLNYLQTNGTPYERTLAKGVFDALYSSDSAPKLVFTDKGKSRYDPQTNTVYLRRDASAAITLHEALHAALQWYVYQNPNAAEVENLIEALNKVVNYTGHLPADARRVQSLLKGLLDESAQELQKNNKAKSKQKQLDAVLELISYGNTLNDFRRALEKIEGNKTVPASFLTAVRNVWKTILSVVKSFLGVEPSVANDVMLNTFALLQKASQSAPTVREGSDLDAAITAEDFDEIPQEPLLKRPGAELPASADIQRFNKKIIPSFLSTKGLFDMLGWGKGVKFAEDKVNAISDAIRKDWPTLTRWTSYVHSQFAVPQDVRAAFERFKSDRQAGYKLTERLATYIQFQSAEKVRDIFAYLDGNKSALANDPAHRELADEIIRWRDFYVQEIGDEKTRNYFKSGKFSETMLFAETSEQVATGAFSVRALQNLLRRKTREESNLEPGWMNLDANGDPVLSGDFYQVYTVDADGHKVPQGFIASEQFQRNGAPAGMYVDPTYKWQHSSAAKGKHTFTAQLSTEQAIQEKRMEDLANGLRNTMAGLAANYASKQFAQGLYDYGRTEATAGLTPVVFDDIKSLNKALGIKLSPDSIINGGSDAARAVSVQHLYRTPNLFVRVPKGGRYGAMSGKLVSGSVWHAIQDATDRQPLIKIQALNTAMRRFKKAKTVYNLGTSVTNVATNFSLAALHDIPMATVAHATKLFAMYEINPNAMSAQDRQLVLAFMNSNALLGDYSSAEVKQSLYDSMTKAVKGSGGSIVDRLTAFAKLQQGNADAIKRLADKGKVAGETAAQYAERVDNFMTEFYAAQDNVFRLAAFLKRAADLSAMHGTLTSEHLQSAGEFASTAFLNYDIDSKAVRILRQTGLPFISWTYAILPVLGRIAVHQPWKLVNMTLAFMLLEQAMAAIAGDDDEELRRKGPEYLRDRMFGFGPYMHVRIPFLGDSQNPVYYRLGDYIPFASLTRGQPNSFMGLDWFPSAISPSGPFISTILIATTGIDPYTGKPINAPTDSMWEKFSTRAKWLATDYVPPPVAEAVRLDKLTDMIQGRTDKPENFASLQMARWIGLKMYNFNVDQGEIAQSKAQLSIMAEYRREIGKLARAEARFETPDWEKFQKRQQELLVRMQEEMAKARGEE